MFYGKGSDKALSLNKAASGCRVAHSNPSHGSVLGPVLVSVPVISVWVWRLLNWPLTCCIWNQPGCPTCSHGAFPGPV